jgi:hypothetical protein
MFVLPTPPQGWPAARRWSRVLKLWTIFSEKGSVGGTQLANLAGLMAFAVPAIPF